MKFLVLGEGKSTNGCIRLLEKHSLFYKKVDNINEITNEYSYMIKSPGIEPYDSRINHAMILGISIITDIELAYMLENPYIIAVTGSNGKTTTVSLLARILSQKYNVVACGNIGYSICDALVDNPYAKMYIVEASSFQLEFIKKFSPKIAVIMNIEPCHIDHHKTFNNYINAKKNININQIEDDYFIYNFDSLNAKRIALSSKANNINFSISTMLSTCHIYDNYIYFKKKKIFKIPEDMQNKMHLISDWMAVISVLECLKINSKAYKKFFYNFKAIEYRIESIQNGIYNDAKSTNPYSTIEALKGFEKVCLICGGYDRGENMEVLIPYLKKLKKVYAYGSTKDIIKIFMEQNNIEVEVFDNLRNAAISCLKERNDNITILYSPMFASFDQYKNYLERGEEFKNITMEFYNKK